MIQENLLATYAHIHTNNSHPDLISLINHIRKASVPFGCSQEVAVLVKDTHSMRDYLH
jgi:hypothetical protein